MPGAVQVEDRFGNPVMHGVDRPAQRGLDPGEGLYEVGLPLPVEPGHADHLARVEVEIEGRRVGPDPHVIGAQHRAVGLLLDRPAGGMRAFAFRPGDQVQDLFLGDLFLVQRAHRHAVAQHGSPVGDLDKLGDPVRHDEDGAALRRKLAHLPEQPLGRLEIERGRALVEDQHARVRQHAAGDRDPLLDRQRQLANDRLRVEIEAQQLAHDLLGPGIAFVIGLRGREQPVRTQEQVVDDRAFIGNKHLLVDVRYAQRAGFRGVRRRFAEDRHLPLIGHEHAGDHLRQRRLARAVAADDGVHLSGEGAQAHAIKRHGRTEGLAHVDDFGRYGRHG